MPITKPAGEISATVMANLRASGNPTPAASSGVTTAASSATSTAISASARYSALVVIAQDPAAEIAAQAARNQHGEDHHRQGVRGVAQEQHELLDEGHLDQDVARADAQEVEQKSQHALLPRQARPQHHAAAAPG